MNIDYYIVDAEGERAVAMADDPEGFSGYRKAKILALKPLISRRLSAAAGIAVAEGLESFGLREAETVFGTNEYGKPYIPDHPEIVFNVSHSGRYAVAAFLKEDRTGGCSLGVDIEQISRMNGRIASYLKSDRGFAPVMEADGLKDLCRRWTATEAFAKCVGSGFAAFGDDFYFENTSPGRIMLRQDIYDGEFEVNEAEAPEGYCITCIVRKRDISEDNIKSMGE